MAIETDTGFGESLSIVERVIVSPAWGRFRSGRLSEGQVVERGAVVGTVNGNGHEIPLVSHVRGIFVGWLAEEGERVMPGRRVARLRLAEH